MDKEAAFASTRTSIKPVSATSLHRKFHKAAKAGAVELGVGAGKRLAGAGGGKRDGCWHITEGTWSDIAIDHNSHEA